MNTLALTEPVRDTNGLRTLSKDIYSLRMAFDSIILLKEWKDLLDLPKDYPNPYHRGRVQFICGINPFNGVSEHAVLLQHDAYHRSNSGIERVE
ncbi:hypothetical protein ACO22_06033 [Paracoccidioides brasiliensis]|uniref:Uncharacterized protein n=1 Tax=Paracoccidioides brasiliensis TaxID=121759 RepID=A0A1D2J8Q1_PARBR|nr:hypothetical protein ACO22_06033 [Paracoccidioides brasiliensis]